MVAQKTYNQFYKTLEKMTKKRRITFNLIEWMTFLFEIAWRNKWHLAI